MELIEDRSYGGNKPYIDLTPVSEWRIIKKIIQHVGQTNWSKIEEHVKNRVSGVCEFCGASETKQGLFGQKAHKFKIEFRYSIDNKTKIATLHRLIYSCASCSQSIHLRQTQLQGLEPYKKAVERLCKFHGLQPHQIESRLHHEQDINKYRAENSIPENLEVHIIEDGVNRLWH